MKTKMVGILICTLLIATAVPAVGHKSCCNESQDIVGFGPWKVYGLFPSVSGDEVTCFLVGPFLRTTTLNMSRFTGHIGIIFIVGEYYWKVNGPPALP